MTTTSLTAVSSSPEPAVRLVLREPRQWKDHPRPYASRVATSGDRLLAPEAIETLRADEQAARHLQFQLLPEDGLAIGPYSFSRRLFPSHTLSGDFLEYFALGERLGLPALVRRIFALPREEFALERAL